MTTEKISKEQLLALMEDIGPVPETVRQMPMDLFVANVAVNLTLLKVAVEHDLESLGEYLDEINEHLIAKEHEFNSPCWQRRTEAIAIQARLEEKLEQVERVAAAIRQALNPEPLN